MLNGFLKSSLSMELKINTDLSSPQEKEIVRLEQQYLKALAEGEIFEVLKSIRQQIKILKSELGPDREREKTLQL
jgi:flagellar biosynthesis regulator FlbT